MIYKMFQCASVEVWYLIFWLWLARFPKMYVYEFYDFYQRSLMLLLLWLLKKYYDFINEMVSMIWFRMVMDFWNKGTYGMVSIDSPCYWLWNDFMNLLEEFYDYCHWFGSFMIWILIVIDLRDLWNGFLFFFLLSLFDLWNGFMDFLVIIDCEMERFKVIYEF